MPLFKLKSVYTYNNFMDLPLKSIFFYTYCTCADLAVQMGFRSELIINRHIAGIRVTYSNMFATTVCSGRRGVKND